MKSNFARIPNDAYFTIDPRVTPALFLGLPELKELVTGVLEPFCGAGHMAEDIAAEGFAVFAADIQNYGYEKQMWKVDFFNTLCMPIGANAIISNSPFKKNMIDTMIQHALSLLPDGGFLALLLNHRFDAAGSRAPLFTEDFGFYARVILPFRILWFAPNENSKDPAHDHLWLIWRKGWRQPSRNVYLRPQLFNQFPKKQVRKLDMHTQPQYQPRAAANSSAVSL